MIDQVVTRVIYILDGTINERLLSMTPVRNTTG